MTPEKKNWKIYKEDIKAEHTSHWDWDYLTHAQIDALIKEAQAENPDSAEPQRRRHRRGWILVAVVLIIGGVWAGYVLLT